jgi:hypothetical protein
MTKKTLLSAYGETNYGAGVTGSRHATQYTNEATLGAQSGEITTGTNAANSYDRKGEAYVGTEREDIRQNGSSDANQTYLGTNGVNDKQNGSSFNTKFAR